MLRTIGRHQYILGSWRFLAIKREEYFFVLKKLGASHRDKTETLRHWRAPLFSRFAGKESHPLCEW